MERSRMLLIASWALMIVACATQQKGINNESLNKAMAEREFEINAQFARPLVTNAMSQIGNSGLLPPGSNIGQINLSGTSNFLRIKGDSVAANLPYYGERQLGGAGYGNKLGIVFEGVPEDLEIQKDTVTHAYTITFNIAAKTENFRVNAQVQPNLSSWIRINSTHRTTISYSGTLQPAKEGR